MNILRSSVLISNKTKKKEEEEERKTEMKEGRGEEVERQKLFSSQKTH